VEADVSGWLVPAGSVDRLAAAMREALATPTSRLTAMGREGAERVARDHDVRREASRLAELFRRVVRGGGALDDEAIPSPAAIRTSR
jgi:glycosyltransferase involved in cell wall biosynthesis